MELYNNIKKYRLRLGMTQEQLAKLAGYTDRSSIAKIESGLVDISQSKLELFAHVLHVSPGELIGRSAAEDNRLDLTASEQLLLECFRQLNEEGQEMATEHVSYLVSTGRYKKNNQHELVEKAQR